MASVDHSGMGANHGYNAAEAAELIELPDSLGKFTPNSPTYGALNHNVKGVWQRYLGWFDGNPANLHALPPAAMGQRYVKAIGGAKAVLQQAESALAGEDPRWAAELLNQLLAAEPSQPEARALQAKVFQILAYQSESGVWRNFYLAGAAELADTSGGKGGTASHAPEGFLDAITTEMSLDVMGIPLNAPKAQDFTLTAALTIADTDETFRVSVGRGVLTHRLGADTTDCDVRLRMSRRHFARLASGATSVADLRADDAIEHHGDIDRFEKLLTLMDNIDDVYQLVTPRLKA